MDSKVFEPTLPNFDDLCSDFVRFHKEHERTYTVEDDEFSTRVNAYAISRKEISILNSTNPFAEFAENR